jgi:hypothetical protein
MRTRARPAAGDHDEAAETAPRRRCRGGPRSPSPAEHALAPSSGGRQRLGARAGRRPSPPPMSPAPRPSGISLSISIAPRLARSAPPSSCSPRAARARSGWNRSAPADRRPRPHLQLAHAVRGEQSRARREGAGRGPAPGVEADAQVGAAGRDLDGDPSERFAGQAWRLPAHQPSASRTPSTVPPRRRLAAPLAA